MIYLNVGDVNTAVATCSVNKQLSNPTYLWSMRHKLTNQSWRFIPYQIPAAVNYTPTYDQFLINIDYNSTQVFTGTSANAVNLHLIDGEYFVKVYEQTSTTNLNPAYSYDVVYEAIASVQGTGTTTTQIAYTATTNVFKVYEG